MLNVTRRDLYIWPISFIQSSLIEEQKFIQYYLRLKVKAVILESSVAGMGWAGTVNLSEENKENNCVS